MRWKASVTPKENRNPYQGWVRLRWRKNAGLCMPLHVLFPHLCKTCEHRIWIERIYYCDARPDVPGAILAVFKCGVCYDLDQLAGKEKP